MFIQITELSNDGVTHLPTLLNLGEGSVEAFRLVGSETLVYYKGVNEEGENFTATSVTPFAKIYEKLKEANLIR